MQVTEVTETMSSSFASLATEADREFLRTLF